MQKTIMVGLLAGVLMTIVGWALNFVFNALFPSFQAIYTDTNIFLPMDEGRGLIFFIFPFVLGIALAWLYRKMSHENQDICNFVWLFFVVAILPPFFINVGAFNLPVAMIVTWSVSMFLEVMVAAALFRKMLR